MGPDRAFLASLGFVVLAGLPTGALAQAGAAAQPAEPAQPVFRSGAEIVRLDVRVLDAQGHPVRDLRADEIEVIEEGRSRPILLFQHIEEPSGAYADVARRTIAGEVSTNQGAPRGHLYVLIFDQHHIEAGHEQRARIAAERFLRTRVRPGDRVALYALPGPGPQIDFTANVDRAASELIRVRGSLERFAPGGLGTIRIHEAYEIGRGNQEILSRVVDRLATQQAGADTLSSGASRAGVGISSTTELRQFESLVKEDARTIATRADEAARRFLLMLADVVRQLAPIEGRKTIVLFSEGFYTDHVTRELEQVAAAAAQSYAVFYAVDLNKREVSLKESEPVGSDQYSEIESRLASLGSLAVETDGLLLSDAGADPGAALAKIADTSQDYYLVGFEPADRSRRGEYQRISVRVKRPRARASTRTGYALGSPNATLADRRRAIDLAIGAPFPQQGLPVRYTTYMLGGGSAGAQRVFMSLAADLPVTPENANRSADVVFVVRSVRDGRVVASGTDTMALPTKADPAASEGTIGTAAYKVQFEAPPGEYIMRVVVREPGGLLGSADRRFDVRRFDATGVAASDLVLGAATGSLPVKAVAYNGEALAGLVELYARRPDDFANVTVSAQLASLTGEAASSVHAELAETRTREDGSLSREARLVLPLNAVTPGDYVVRATVREGSETVAELTREVQVLPGNAPAPVSTAKLDAGAYPAAFAPEDVLGGEFAQRYIRSLADAARGTTYQTAADQAMRGAWSAVEPSLGVAPASSDRAWFGLRGLARYSRREYSIAADDLRIAAGEPPAALASFILGWIYASAGQAREAIGAWRAAAFADPTLLPAHLAIADAYVRASEPALAIQALRTGLNALPGSPELREKLSALERRQ
jgi:VWFA-related protein